MPSSSLVEVEVEVEVGVEVEVEVGVEVGVGVWVGVWVEAGAWVRMQFSFLTFSGGWGLELISTQVVVEVGVDLGNICLMK